MLPRLLVKRKLIIISLIFFLFSSFLSKAVQAYSTPESTYQFQFENAVFKTDEMNLQSFVHEVMKAVAASGINICVGCLGCDEVERQKSPGALAGATSLIAGVYASPPASGVEYLASLGNKLGIVQPVYAQPMPHGIGFRSMENLQPVWVAFRNLAYGLFVIIFVFIGFAIMFRIKISPQAVITIESALPKIIIALLLVTFSYAIVGFMIDIMYVLCFLITSIFRDIPLVGGISAGDLIDKLTFVPFKTTGLSKTLFTPTTKLIIETIMTDLIFFIFLPFISFIITSFFGGPLGALLVIFSVIISLIAILRCVWTLLKTYALIVVGLIFAPLQIAIGTLPGSDAIGSWFKSMLGNIAVLPTMVAMFFLSSYLIFVGVATVLGQGFESFIKIILWLVPGTQITPGYSDFFSAVGPLFSPVGFWEFFSGFILSLVGVMVLWMAPKTSDMVKSFIMGKPFEFGTAIGEALGPVRGGAQALTQARYGTVEKDYQWAKRTGGKIGKRKTSERAIYQTLSLRGKLKGE